MESSLSYAATLTLSVAVVGASILREGVIQNNSMVSPINIGILFNNIGDIWYYNLSYFGI